MFCLIKKDYIRHYDSAILIYGVILLWLGNMEEGRKVSRYSELGNKQGEARPLLE